MPATRVGPTTRLLYRDHQPSLWLEDASRAYAFDGDPALFRLAAEALRIRMAALFDPMLAVKGRLAGAEDFSVTGSEVLYGKNADRYRLALVSVSPDGPEHDEVCYLIDPFRGVSFDDFAVDSVRFNWHEMWSRGRDPV
jgi:hypothetical protein